MFNNSNQNNQNNQNSQASQQNSSLKRQNILIAIVVSLALAYMVNMGANYMYFNDVSLEAIRKQEQLNALVAENKELVALTDQYNELEKQAEQLNNDYKKLNVLIPEERELPEILNFLYNAGLSRNLKLSHFSQSEKVARSGALNQLPVTVSVVGTDSDVARYLDDFNRFKYVGRLLNIDSVKFVEETDPKLQGLFTAEIRFSAFLSDPKALALKN